MSDDVKRPDHFWDLQSAALVVVLVQIAALRLVFTDWAPFLSVTQTLGFLGVLLGLALGYTSLLPRTVRGFGLAYGLIVIPAQLLIAVERTDLLYLDLDFMLLRLLDSVILLIRSQPVYDTLFFVAVVAIGFWSVGLYAGYQLTRRQNFLGIILPAGIVMLVVQVYDAWASLRVWLLAVYIFTALILLGRLYFFQSKTGWKAQHVFFTSDAEGDVSRVALVFAAVAIFAAWIFPSALSSVRPAAKAWTEFTQPIRERLSDAVSALDSPYRVVVDGDFYGSELKLGNSAPISDTPVLYVKVDRVTSKPARYYWRGRVYDQYLNGQWVNSDEAKQKNFIPETDLLQPNDPLTRADANFTVTLNFPKQELMYAPSEIIWTNRPSRLMTTPIDDSAFDVIAWLASPKLVAGDSYKIRALIANPSVEELRGAGGEYPQWVKDRYLQVPPEFESQLKELAGRITETQATPYDKAQAVTAFLRKEIEYTTKITDSPPSGEDPMMWVLFEYKQGFCMYSASSEVLMLRSLGIPARMAVGFSQGEYDASRARYVVARLNSHAWPEVYFPGIGWVEFEPTGNQDPLNRPREPIKPLVDDNTTNPRNPPKTPLNADEIDKEVPDPLANGGSGSLTFARVMRYLYPALLLGLFAFGIFIIQRYSIVDRLPVYLEGRYIKRGSQPPKWLALWSKWATLIPMQRAFHSIDLSLRWLGHSQPAQSTPLERANILAELLPSMQEEIAALQEEHEATLFTNRAGSVERARRASRKILLETARVRLKKVAYYRDRELR
jgi:transglutaminase-like putative cysteine protease